MKVQFILWFKSSLLCCLLFACLQGMGQLQADFTATPVQGCSPLVVQFTDISTGSPTSWFWDLGNGSTTVSQNPGVIYFNPGSYTIKLVVKNGAAQDSVVRVSYITVNDKPAINFSASDTTGCTPFFVQFTDLSAAGSGTITQWQWDFGDGNSSTVQSPSNVFITPGTYNITLKVTNSGGCYNTFIKTAYIQVKESPSAAFTTSSATSCSPPVTVNFTNASSGNNITGYSWDFGDGATSAATNPSHNFTTAGVFNTVMVVTNQAGCTDTLSKLISIGAVSPDFNSPDSICVNNGFSIVNTSSPATVSSSWTFGDGSFSTQVNPNKTYTVAGTYNIKLVNNFGACKDSIIKKIVVLAGPVPNFTFVAPPAGCTAPITVSFTSTSAGAISYLWSFGDGATSTQANPVHTYTALGTYTVKLVVKNTQGCTDSIVRSNIISITQPTITSLGGGLPYYGCAPLTSMFTPVISSPEPITNYLWNFGDNTTSGAATPTHTYSASGTYNVTLIITSVSGCKDSFTLSQAVKIGTRPAANFTATPLNSCAFQKVQFTNTSTGTTTAWSWNFGDTTTSSDENPLHHYNDTGFFTVTFVAENNGCRDTIIKQNYIYIQPPISYFTTKTYCDTPFLKKFIDKSIGALTYLWNFGDGNTSALPNPSHTYAAAGTYLVKLRVDNPPCYDEFTDTVYVINEQPGITVSGTACKNTPVTITATGVNPANIRQYLWNFGDTSSPDSSSAPTIVHNYTVTGTYNVTLETTDLLGCKKTVTQTNAVTIYGPTAKLVHPPGACINSTVTFTDQSIPYPGFPIVSWTIDYGDGTIITTANPVFTHTYVSTGSYNIQFTVKDSYGCTDIINDSAAIIVTRARADFNVLDSLSCRQSLIKFNNTSTGSTLTYLWNFGDGGTSTTRTPSHLYTSNGIYTISLVVTDRFGCKDSTKKDSAVLIGNAVASFTASDTLLICPPAQVNFTGSSSFYSSLKWDFGDGSTSTLPNPNHFFLSGGTYNVKLFVYGYGSCVDSVVKQIVVRGPQGTLSYSPTGHCVPATISFLASARNITGSFIWDFGDGTTAIATSNVISHTYITVGRYIPKLLLRDTTINCTVSLFGKDTIAVSDAKAYIKMPLNLYCDSATVDFADSSVLQYDTVQTYKWTFGDGGTSSAQNPVHTFTSPGIYTINMSLQTVYGCKDTAAPVMVKVVKSPSINVTGSSSVCVNDTITFALALSMPDTSVTTYQWTFGNGNTSNLATPPPQIYPAANSYTIKTIAVNSSGCTDTVLKQIIVNPLPTINAGTDTTICRGQSVTLAPSGTATSYVWQANTTLSCTNCTNPVAMPDTTQKYVVTGTSTNGCIARDSLVITVAQRFILLASLRDTICRGQTITLSAGGADNYIWSPAAGLSNTNTPNPTASPDTTTIYQVIGNDANNCFTDTAYIPVIVYNAPQFNIIPDVLSVSAGSFVTLATTGSPDIVTYSWTPPTGLSCTNCPQPQANPVAAITTYTAVAANAGGCTTRDQVTINILCGTGNVFIPNTFSPNNDGSNDVFYPRGKGITGIRNMLIYNRWGAVVFQRGNFDINDESAGWDGTYKGLPAPQDVYVYHMDVICGTGTRFLYKGDVTLIR